MSPGSRPARGPSVLRVVLVLVVVALVLPPGAPAEQASEPTAPAAGQLDAGREHTCSLDAGVVRCWGLGFSGQLGYGIPDNIGDNEPPGRVGSVNLGPGRFATAISAGDFHTCALLDDRSVRCWGFGGDGRLGYGNTATIGDDETPGSVGPVNLGRPAIAISAGGAHTCALRDDGSVLCWGFGENGRLGYGDPATIGDDETPGSLAPVQLGRPATAISAGGEHTCALLDDRSVRCWGSSGLLFGGDGRLGYGTPETAVVGDNETPASVGPLVLGAGATAISAGEVHTCAVLDGGSVRCWGNAVGGRLGYANTEARVGDNEAPASFGPVSLGGPAAAISVSSHSCARLTSGAVRCWGPGAAGRLGYANTNDVGDDEVPSALPTVSIGGAATAISAGSSHTCAKLGEAVVRCWGEGRFGRLGYGNETTIGDDEPPSAAGPVDLTSPASPRAPTTPPPPPSPPPPPAAVDPLDEALRRQAARRVDLRACRASATSRMRTAQRQARRRYRQGAVRARVLRQIARTVAQRRQACLRRFGRTPGRVTSLAARRSSRTAVVLAFDAVGTDGSKLPAARAYVVKQSLRPIRTARHFDRAKALCGGTCRFDVVRPGDDITVNVTRLRRRTTYYYAVVAKDNVSARRGPRSKTVSIRTG